jgi:hypothetical protein
MGDLQPKRDYGPRSPACVEEHDSFGATVVGVRFNWPVADEDQVCSAGHVMLLARIYESVNVVCDGKMAGKKLCSYVIWANNNGFCGT